MKGILDTSVVIDLDDARVVEFLPELTAVSAVTIAELGVGAALAKDRVTAARRQFRLQQVESSFPSLPFTVNTARHFALLSSHLVDLGMAHRPRIADAMIAATAVEHGIPLYTRDRGMSVFDPFLRVYLID